jgi:hypothetical protein
VLAQSRIGNSQGRPGGGAFELRDARQRRPCTRTTGADARSLNFRMVRIPDTIANGGGPLCS